MYWHLTMQRWSNLRPESRKEIPSAMLGQHDKIKLNTTDEPL